MRSSEVASRMTGFSTPIFGLSWTPPTLDRDVARQVLAFLEDRRVLYSPYEVEVADEAIRSVVEIRHLLTDVLGRAGIAEDLAASIRAIRSACRQFMNEVRVDDSGWHGRYPSASAGFSDHILNQALGRLRGVAGIHVGQMSVKYGLDIEDGLASILPLPG